MRFIMRWTVRLAFVAALAMAAAALMNLKREWELLSEAEIRERLERYMDGRVRPEQRALIEEKVVTYLKGISAEATAAAEAAQEAAEAAQQAAEAAQEAAGE
jgi:hypothetical protein